MLRSSVHVSDCEVLQVLTFLSELVQQTLINLDLGQNLRKAKLLEAFFLYRLDHKLEQLIDSALVAVDPAHDDADCWVAAALPSEKLLHRFLGEANLLTLEKLTVVELDDTA